jgi:hypothetical protein
MAKARMKTSRPRLTLDISPALRRRIKMAAAVTRLLDRAVPAGAALRKKADGTVSAETLLRFAALRAEQRAPFPEDSADLIRESRAEREDQL